MFQTGIDDLIDAEAATNGFLIALGAEALALLDDL
jgi:hypothetical protein